ncbi:DUF6646 family protein [Flavobacterium terrigena]|uniref:Outer membrane protein beta-barrel domain-containing protein n=1 Tax=Flavobacterium terrigena TaxID=402734 RepID=A0A1H6VJD6_9FLAO|nr:DUF6646 family protein [Flavobacterium terrigena]SEJ00870.1 hypothetical protein SAMN05660918_2135 [Flavobacterium terrigena]
MRRIVFIVCLGMGFLANAQAYKGKEDLKLQIGATIQNGGTGIALTNDYGIGENMSFGFSASYMLSADNGVQINGTTLLPESVKPKFQDRVDVKARFNANLGSVIGLEDNMDIYPGLNIGTRNFGGHLGFRYFFTDGFGVYSEMSLPIAEYDSTPGTFGHYNNQFVFQIGASFNL